MGLCIIWRDNQHFSKCFPCLLHASLLNERKDEDAMGSREHSIALKGLAGPAFGLLGFSFYQSGSSHSDGCIERIWIKGTEADRRKKQSTASSTCPTYSFTQPQRDETTKEFGQIANARSAAAKAV